MAPPWRFKCVHPQRRVSRIDDAHLRGTVTYPISKYPFGCVLCPFGPIHSSPSRAKWYRRTILVRVSNPVESGRTTLSDYRVALTTPAARRPLVASLLARLPIAMIGISGLLYVQHRTGTYAVAGLVSASTLVGVAIGSVVQGRLIDRFGPTRPLLVVVALFAVTMAGLVAAIESGAATPVLVVLAGGIGLFEPMCGSASRALWGRLLPSGPALTAAYSYEAISMEVFFILGPGLAGALIAAPWPGTGMVLGGACMAVGAVLVALSPAVREIGRASCRERG